MNPDENAPARAENTGPGSNQEQPQDTTTAPEGKAIGFAALSEEPVIDYYHARTERFLVKNSEGRWLPHSSTSYKRVLAKRGIKIRTESGASLSEADHEILNTQDHFDVDAHGPLCGRNSGFIDEGGTRFLVTEDMHLIEPKPGKCPTIHAILKGLFYDGESPEIGEAQVNTFCGLIKSSAEALRAGRHQQQQALAICGPKDCGKSFSQHHIYTPCLAGRSADAARYFLKGSDFNADLFKVEHLVLDDAHSSTWTRDRVAFGAKLKAHTVGASVKDLHGKGKDAIHMRPWWRISITLNDGPESMMVLPPLDENFADKLILLRASSFIFPEPINTPEDKERFERKIRDEIPAFLYFLLNEYVIPEQYTDRRYNVATFHHPGLKESLESLSPEVELLELIDLAFSQDFGSQGRVRHTAAKIEERIACADKRRADRLFHHANSCGSYLGRLAMKHPKRVMKSDTAKERGWMLCPPE